MAMKSYQTIENLLKNYTIDKNGCWIWQRSINNGGYGYFAFRKGAYLAHRASYTLHVGKIPEGLELDHLCCVRSCINPAHLEPVTPAENSRRRSAKLTHCKYGHAFTADNVYLDPNGWRRCRTCIADMQEKYKVEVTCLNCGKAGKVYQNPRA